MCVIMHVTCPAGRQKEQMQCKYHMMLSLLLPNHTSGMSKGGTEGAIAPPPLALS